MSAMPVGKSARASQTFKAQKTIHISVTKRGCCEDIVITLTRCKAKAFFLTLVAQSRPWDCEIYSMTDFSSKPLCCFL